MSGRRRVRVDGSEMTEREHQLVIDAVKELAVRMVAAGSDPIEVVNDLLDEFVSRADAFTAEMREKTEQLDRIMKELAPQ